MDISRQELRFFLHVTANCMVLFLMIGMVGVATNAQKPGRVVTEPSVNVQRGKAVLLPCFFEVKPVAVQWNKGSSATEDMIVHVDTYYNPGQKDGPGYLKGTFDVATNFSLIVKEVKLEDRGRYFCVVVSFETPSRSSNHTDLTVFVPPMEPFPTISPCSTSTTRRHTEKNCIIDTREDSMNVSCTVNGYFPDFRLLFTHELLNVDVLNTWEWNNTDGTYGRSLTIRAVPYSKPYICVASGKVRSGGVNDSSASIVLKKEILEPLAPEHNRSKEIGIILALFLVSVIIPMVSFLLIVRKTKIRARYQKVHLTSTRHQQKEPLSGEDVKRCKRDLRYHYKKFLTQIRTGPLEPETLIDLGDTYITPFLMKDFVPKTVDEGRLKSRNPGFPMDKQYLGDYGNPRSKKGESLTHNDFLQLISPGGPQYRFLLVGEAGVGKTTFLAKLVNDWLDDKGLKDIKLMFHVPLSEAVKGESFGEVIRMYLSDSNDCVPHVDEHIRKNQETAMFLFDGLDEFGEDITVRDRHNAIVQILRGERYKDAIVVVTTRPWKADQILSNRKLRKLFTCIRVEGLSNKKANEYVSKFFKGNRSLADSLIRSLEEDKEEGGVFSNVMASYPIYLAMYCHICRDDSKQLNIMTFETVSQVMEEMIRTLKERYESKAKQTEPNEDCSLRLQRVERCFEEIGRIAYQGCLSNRLIIHEESRVVYNNSIETAYKLGVLTRERGIAPKGRMKYVDEYRFPHKLFQDYLAAVHLATRFITERAAFNRALHELLTRSGNRLDRFEYLWCFLASRNKDVAKTTLEFLVGWTNVENGGFVIRVAFECQDKDALAPFTSAILKEKRLRLSNKKSFVAYLHFLAPSSKLDTLILDSLPENKTWAKKAAEVIFSLENLRTLVINICVNYTAEIFYENMAQMSTSSKIETLVHLIDNLSPVASHHYARSIFSMPRLRILDIQYVHLDNTFYETMAEDSPSSNIEKLSIMFGKKQSSDAAGNLSTGIFSIPQLSSLYLCNADDILFNKMRDLMSTSPSSFKISTLILEDAVLTRWNMDTLLSLDSLRSIRFIDVKAKKEGERDFGSDKSPLTQDGTVGSSLVKELSMDDVSLPHMIELDVHKHCSQVQKVQVDFKSNINDDVIMKLQKFTSASHLYFVGYWSYDVVLYKSEVKDTILLCRSLMTSWSQIVSLVIADIMIGDTRAVNILETVKKHQSLKNITLTRCGTTNALNAYVEESVTMTHGMPVTLSTFDKRYADNLQSIFEVITVDHEP